MLIAFMSYVLRKIADLTCSEWSQVCRASSDMLSHIYSVVVIFLLIVAATKAQQISAVLRKVKTAIEVMASDGGTKKKHD
jgi:atlastin